MNFTVDRIILVLAIASSLFIGTLIDLPTEIFNFIVSVMLLGFELYTQYSFRRKLASSNVFKLKSQEWIGGIGMVMFVVYHFSNETMNTWNITAIVLISLYGLLYSYRNRVQVYAVSEKGIHDLMFGKEIEYEQITGINTSPSSISIDTEKYRNHLVVNERQLVSASIDELKRLLQQFNQD